MTIYDEGIKVHLPTPEISKLVQEKLFEKGCSWVSGGCITREYSLYLFVDDKYITASYGDKNFFNKYENKQVHYLQILADDFDGQLFKTNIHLYYQDTKGYAHWVDDTGHYDCVDWSKEFVKYQDEYTFLNVNEEEIKMTQPNEMPKLEAGKHLVS